MGLPDAIRATAALRLIQQANGLCASEDELRYRASDVAHLDRYLHGDITQLCSTSTRPSSRSSRSTALAQ